MKRYWPLAFLFGSIALVLSASLLENAFTRPIPGDLLRDLQESILIDSTDIKDVERLTVDRNGKPFSALRLNGSDNFVRIGETSTGSLPENFSFCFWVLVEKTGKFQTLFQKGENCPDGNADYKGQSYEIILEKDGTLSMKVFASPGNDLSEYLVFTSAEALSLNQWTFVVITYSETGQKFQCFINARPTEIESRYRSSQANFQNIHLTRSVLKIGASEHYCGHLHYFEYLLTGVVDEIRIFKRPLSGSEIHTLYEPEIKKYMKYRIIILIILIMFIFIILFRHYRLPDPEKTPAA